MIKIITTLLVLVASTSVFAQENNVKYRVIPSLTEWIEEINNWPEERYNQQYLHILFDPEKDAPYIITDNSYDTLTTDELAVPKLEVNKEVEVWHVLFDNEQFQYHNRGLKNLHFKERFLIFYLENGRFGFKNIQFDKLHLMRLIETRFFLTYNYCQFNSSYIHNNPAEPVSVGFYNCSFSNRIQISSDQAKPQIIFMNCNIQNNDIEFGAGSTFNSVYIKSTQIEKNLSFWGTSIENRLVISNTSLGGIELDGARIPAENTYVPFEQVSNKIYIGIGPNETPNYDNGNNEYKANSPLDFEYKEYYDQIIASYSKLLSVYKNRSEQESYNACYVEMREKQTAYSHYQYKKKPGFSSLIVFQLNKFMGIFSDYGTRPTKAIIFSLYVILLFSLIYLFFPNSWDSHGKHRIIHRYTFFMKYLNRNQGIHEVYLEEKQPELLAFHEFKDFIETNSKTVPRFFTATALPLYKWSLSGTKFTASFLSRFDVLKGTWLDVPKSHRWWKMLLLIGAFLIAIIYDVLIKILNALMLSINTFTTLGFGEIPIKGLPRYLAIIQGFIGWFMLTIFSVSLISQLLN